MGLSAIQRLPTNQKLLWLQSPEGQVQLKLWLVDGLSLHKVASLLCIQCTTLYGWCERYPELAEITGRHFGGTAASEDLSRPAAYRLVVGYNHTTRRGGTIAANYPTAEAAWATAFIRRYFASYGESSLQYRDDYLKKMSQDYQINLIISLTASMIISILLD